MCRHALMHACVRNPKQSSIRPSTSVVITCVLLPIILEIWVLHRYFIASSSAIHVRQVQHECKEHAPDKTQKCLWSRLGPSLVKLCRPGHGDWQQPLAIHLAFGADGDQVYCGVCACRLDGPVLMLFSDVFSAYHRCCIQMYSILWWIMLKLNITHIFAFRRPSPIARSDVVRFPNSQPVLK